LDSNIGSEKRLYVIEITIWRESNNKAMEIIKIKLGKEKVKVIVIMQ
jgi:hypothetical protein